MGTSALAERPPRRPELWFRALLAHGSLGPGKIKLMRLLLETKSVSAAAKQLKMSHARSVKLVAEINTLSSIPLIETRAGGPNGGGALLTSHGIELLKQYDRLSAAVERAAAPHLIAFEDMLSPRDGGGQPSRDPQS